MCEHWNGSSVAFRRTRSALASSDPSWWRCCFFLSARARPRLRKWRRARHSERLVLVRDRERFRHSRTTTSGGMRHTGNRSWAARIRCARNRSCFLRNSPPTVAAPRRRERAGPIRQTTATRSIADWLYSFARYTTTIAEPHTPSRCCSATRASAIHDVPWVSRAGTRPGIASSRAVKRR